MRPAGEVRQALLAAAEALATPERAPTMREIAEKAQVGYKDAQETIKNLKRAKVLTIPRRRAVNYRRCPVAEYALSAVAAVRPAGWEALRAASDAICRAA